VVAEEVVVEVPHDNPIHTEVVVVVVVAIVDMMIVRGGMNVLIMMVEGAVDTNDEERKRFDLRRGLCSREKG